MLKGIVFDLDNTLVTSDLDFKLMRTDLGISESEDILEHLKDLSGEERRKKEQIIHLHELNSIKKAEPFIYLEQLFSFLKSRSIKKAILTRNSKYCTDFVLRKFNFQFDQVLTREDVINQKPHPEGLLKILKQWGLMSEQVIWVGDSKMDIETGNRAGIKSFYFNHQKRLIDHLEYTEFTNYLELQNMLKLQFVEA